MTDKMTKQKDKKNAKVGIGQKKVTILGVGGLGANTGLLLTQAGCKHLKLIDFDRVEASNLNRGQVFRYEDVGKYKVDVAAENIGKVNQSVHIETEVKELLSYDDIVRVIDSADFAVRCADRPFAYFNKWFNDACIDMNKPFIFGGMAEYIGMYGPLCIPRRTACFRCAGISGNEENIKLLNEDTMAAPSWGPILGFIGDLMANDIIYYLNGKIPNIAYGHFMIDATTMIVVTRKTFRDPDCPACGNKKDQHNLKTE